jgi:hypothetical protein
MSEGAAIERSRLPNDEADPVRGFKVAVANVGAPFYAFGEPVRIVNARSRRAS